MGNSGSPEYRARRRQRERHRRQHVQRTPTKKALRSGRRRSKRSRTTDRRDDLWVVQRADHSAKSRTDPQLVFGHLPAPGPGTDTGRGLGSLRRGRRGVGRRGPGPIAPTRRAQAPRPARPPAERRSRVRPRPSRPGTATGAPTGGLQETGARDGRPFPSLSSGLRASATAQPPGAQVSVRSHQPDVRAPDSGTAGRRKPLPHH